MITISNKSSLYSSLIERNIIPTKKNHDQLDEMSKYYYEALDELEKMNFPIENEATSYFAYLIGYTKSIIDKNKDTKEGLKIIKKVLLEEIPKPYSNYHIHVSMEMNDVGCKTYYLSIKELLLDLKEKDKKNIIAKSFVDDSDADDCTCQSEIGKLGFIIAASMSTRNKEKSINESIKEKVRIIFRNDY